MFAVIAVIFNSAIGETLDGRMHSEYRFLLDQANNDQINGAIVVSGEGTVSVLGVTRGRQGRAEAPMIAVSRYSFAWL